jgi:hypothetical protein
MVEKAWWHAFLPDGSRSASIAARAIAIVIVVLSAAFGVGSISPVHGSGALLLSVIATASNGFCSISTAVAIFLFLDSSFECAVVLLMPLDSLQRWVDFLLTGASLSPIAIGGTVCAVVQGLALALCQASRPRLLFATLAAHFCGYGLLVPGLVAKLLGASAALVVARATLSFISLPFLATVLCVLLARHKLGLRAPPKAMPTGVAVEQAQVPRTELLPMPVHVDHVPEPSDTFSPSAAPAMAHGPHEPHKPHPLHVPVPVPVHVPVLVHVPMLVQPVLVHVHVPVLVHVPIPAQVVAPLAVNLEAPDSDVSENSSASPSHSSEGDDAVLAANEAAVFGDV